MGLYFRAFFIKRQSGRHLYKNKLYIYEYKGKSTTLRNSYDVALFQKYLTAKNRYCFRKKVPQKMLDRVVNMPLCMNRFSYLIYLNYIGIIHLVRMQNFPKI